MAGGDDLHLPLEISREILIRLPVKSILRFGSVSKSWYSLVSCPNFISDNAVKNLNKNPNRVLLHRYPSIVDWEHGICSFSSHDKSFTESREHNEVPESFLGFTTSIIGSCNGLICLQKWRLTNDGGARVINLVIWNPTIRKIVELPSITHSRQSSFVGFGFDSETSDYKVLLCSIVVCGNSARRVFRIFDLRKGVWRDISPRDPNLWYAVGRYPDCYLDGSVYWSGCWILFSFNFSGECFRKIKLPDCAGSIYNRDGSHVTTRCVTFGGLIRVIVFSKYGEDGSVVMSKSCSVWAMDEYGLTESWTKVYDIDLQSARVLPSTRLSPHQFLLLENDEVLMVHALEYGADLVLYNAGNRKSKCVLSAASCTKSMWIYEESLVLM